jgi:hypothetical protein
MRRRYLVAVLMLATIGGMSSCGDDGSDTRSQVAKAFTEQDVTDYYRRHNEQIQHCMAAEGFRYVAFRPMAPREAMGLSAQEFTRRYGFGISTLIDYEAGSGDPNVVIRAALPPQERARYDEHRDRCTTQAQERLGLPPNVLAVPNGDEYLDVAPRAQADPRVAEARRHYADCVAGYGFSGTSGEALQTGIEDRVAPLREAYLTELQRRHQRGADTSQTGIDEVLGDEQLASLRQIQDYELRAAAADEQCGRHLYPVIEAIHDEYMKEYLNGK